LFELNYQIRNYKFMPALIYIYIYIYIYIGQVEANKMEVTEAHPHPHNDINHILLMKAD